MSDLKPLNPIRPLGNNLPQAKGSETSPQMRNVVQGKVISDLGSNIFLVRTGGGEHKIISPTPLTIGQNVQLTPSKTEPQQLQLASGVSTVTQTQTATTQPLQNSSQPPNIFQLLSLGSAQSARPIDLASLLQVLQQGTEQQVNPQTLNTLSLFTGLQQNFTQNPQEGATILEKLFSLLGLSHEKNIANNSPDRTTLKNGLLELLHSSQEGGQVSKEAGKNLSNLLFSQLALLQSSLQGEAIIPLPLPFLEKGFLHLEEQPEQKKDSSEPEDIQCCLYIELSSLGNLQIQISGNQSGIFLNIKTESAEISQYLDEHLETLTTALSNFIPVRGVRTEEGASDVATQLLALATKRSSQLINTQA